MPPRRRHIFIGCFALCAAVIAILATRPKMIEKIPGGDSIKMKLQGKSTVADHVAQFGEIVKSRWQPFFRQAGVLYPPKRLVFAAFKTEKRFDFYAADDANKLHFIRSISILAASGKLGRN